MGSRYLFICLYVWLEKYFSRGDYKKREETVTTAEMEVPMDLTTTTRQVGSIAIVDITGRIVLGEESSALRNLVADLLKNGHKKILFNLANVSYIDSSGLGQLISTFITVRKQDGELKLFGLNNEVHDLLQITKLCTVFDISDNEAAAVKSFTRSAATA
jgi:anti-sigma B factor antagonist